MSERGEPPEPQEPAPSREPAGLDELGAALERAAAQDPALRAGLARLTGWLGALLERLAPAAAPPSPARLRDEPRPSGILPLRLGDKTVDVGVHDEPARIHAVRQSLEERRRTSAERLARGAQEPSQLAAIELALVARRARLKAEACRWASERRRRLEEGQDFEATVRPRDEELVARARELPSCILWPLSRYEEQPSDARLETLAGTYEALASAAELCVFVCDDPDDERAPFESVYQLLAESQSALRFGISSWTSQRAERDQDDAFHWLRQRTEEDRVYVQRHMRLQDPADPEGWHELLERIEAERARVEAGRQDARRLHQGLNRLRFHAQRVLEPLGPSDAREHWHAVARTIEELVDGGLRPSDVRLREILLPLQDELPEALQPGPGLTQVLAELDRHLALREAEESARPTRADPSPEVMRVRALLGGKRAVLIGGHERRRSREALEEAFGLSELRWMSTAPHTSLEVFEPEIARPETVVVLLAIRWSSHAYEGVKHLCKKHGKAFVRLPRGYGPNQVAHEILEQASRQLG